MNLARQCSRFSSCSVNNCPLDGGYPAHFVHPDDTQQVCTMAKAIRMRIAATDPDQLPMRGMKAREWAGFKRYESLTLAARTQMAKAGKDRLLAYRKDKQAKISEIETKN